MLFRSTIQAQAQSHINYGGSWYGSGAVQRAKDYKNVDFNLIYAVKNVRDNFVSTIKTRIEEHNVQFYAESESDLQLISKLLATDYCCIDTITGPRVGTEQLLSSDVIITKNIPYKYKVMIRDGAYDLTVKEQIFNLLEAQEDVKITAGLTYQLRRPWNGDRKSTRLNSSHIPLSRMPSSA